MPQYQTSNTDTWALWPDDFMVPLEELPEFEHRSDDYSLVEVLEYDEHDQPCSYILTREPDGLGIDLQNQVTEFESQTGFQASVIQW